MKILNFGSINIDYVYRVHKELADGLRAEHASYGGTPSASDSATATRKKISGRDLRDLEKKLRSLERKMAKLDEEKKLLEGELLAVTEVSAVEKLRERRQLLDDQVAAVEEEWMEAFNALESAR